MNGETTTERWKRRERLVGEVQQMSDRELDVLIARGMGKRVEKGPGREGEETDYYVLYFGDKVTQGDIRQQPRVLEYSADGEANGEMSRWVESQENEVRGRYRRWAFHFAPGLPTGRPGTTRTRAEAFVLAVIHEVEP